MNAFLTWFEANRKPIGYTVGGINVLNGLLGIMLSNAVSGVFWLVLGAAIIIDTKMFK